MKVVGLTTAQELFIGSRDRNFRMNEILIIEDQEQGNLIGEVVEAKTFNRFIPLDIGGDFVDSSVLESLKVMGYDIDQETIYIAKVRLLKEAQYPILTGSSVRVPKFHEVKKIIAPTKLDQGLLLGSIRNSDDLTKDMDDNLKNILDIYEDDSYIEQKDIPYIFDYKAMHEYPHIGIFGGSGSGKSFGLRVILEELMKKNIPTIVLDPHYEMDFSEKSESKFAKTYSDKYVCMQIGLDTGIKFQDLNISELISLLNTSSHLTESMENVVGTILKRNDTYGTFLKRIDDLLDAQDQGSLENIENKIAYAENQTEEKEWEEKKRIYEKYDKSCPQASVRGVRWRLVKLANEGVFNHDINSIIDNIKSGKLIVVRGSTRLIQVFSTFLLEKLYKLRRQYRESVFIGGKEDFFPPFIIVTDEAHNFAPKGFETPSKSIIKEIAQEGRKYGVFLILATQRPTLLDETTTAQLNTKFIFRTVRASDIDTIKEETDISIDEAKRLPYLTTGDVFISSAKLGRSSYVRIRAAHTRSPHKENPFDELSQTRNRSYDEFLSCIKEYLPLDEGNLMELSSELRTKYSMSYSVDQLQIKLDEMVIAGILKIDDSGIWEQYKLNDE